MPQDLIQDDYLREMFSEPSPVYAYIRRANSKFNLGADIVGAHMIRVQALLDLFGMSELADRLVYAPGDRTLNFGSNADELYNNVNTNYVHGPTPNYVKVGLGMPIAYDIWYTFPAGNVLNFGGKTAEETMAKLADFFEAVDDAKPLRLCESPPAPGPYTIKQARFEVWQTDGGPNYSSVGPKSTTNDYVGYVAFPVGPLGVMWNISVATQSSLGENGTTSSVHPVDGSNGVLSGGLLLPPFELSVEQIFGEELMSKGWLTTDDSVAELYAEPFAGQDDFPKHKWLRYWIKPENTTIVPGEFVGLMCRPWPLHCWWYQETAPFVYSGTWVETEFYTSGVVKEVIEPEEGEVGNRYRVWVKNEEIIVKSSDFLEYEEDEQIGLLKTWREGEPTVPGGEVGPAGATPGSGVFDWQGLTLQNTGEALNTEWVIVPVSFFEADGSGVGGI